MVRFSVAGSSGRSPSSFRHRPFILIKRTELGQAPVIPVIQIKTEPEAGTSFPTTHLGSPMLPPDFSDRESATTSSGSSRCWSPASSLSSNTSCSAPPSPSPNLVETDTEAEPGKKSSKAKSEATSETLECKPTHQHSKPKPFQCEICGNGFSCMVSLKRHLETIHDKTKMQQKKCLLCDETLQSWANFRFHLRGFHRTPQQPEKGLPSKWKCHWSGCDKLFLHQKTLRYHIEAIHKNNLYECPRCHRKFSKVSDLNTHKLLNTCTLTNKSEQNQKKHIMPNLWERVRVKVQFVHS